MHGKVGRSFAVDVDLSGGGLDEQTSGEQLNVLYRMAFNQLAEGWAGNRWRSGRWDYYRFKFLPAVGGR